MTGCRNCEQLTSGDCGAHGPMVTLIPTTFTPVGPSLPLDTAMHRAPLEVEIARLTAELAAEREQRAEAEARLDCGLTDEEAAARPDRNLCRTGAKNGGQDCALCDDRDAERTIDWTRARLAEAEARERRLREALDGRAGPWCRKELDGWSIVGMNHYSVAGVRHLFVSMAKDGRCIKAESAYEPDVWTELRRLAVEPDADLRVHVAAAVERVVAAARGCIAEWPHSTAEADEVLAAVERAAKETP